MSSYRKKRGLNARDTGFHKDDRLIIVASDDTYAPLQYFSFFPLPRVRLLILPPVDTKSAAKHVLDNLLACDEDYDERWLLLDVDHYAQGHHVASYMAAIRDAQAKGVRVALSKPCFEVWLLLHHVPEDAIESLTDCNSVTSALRSALGEYNKTCLKLQHFPLGRVQDAMDRSLRLDQDEYKIPTSNTTRVCQLWQSITSKMDPWQQLIHP